MSGLIARRGSSASSSSRKSSNSVKSQFSSVEHGSSSSRVNGSASEPNERKTLLFIPNGRRIDFAYKVIREEEKPFHLLYNSPCMIIFFCLFF